MVIKPRILYVDAFSSRAAQSNVWGMTRAYKAFANLKLFDYRHVAEARGAPAMNAMLMEVAKDFGPDFIHLGKCELVKGTTIQQIRERVPSCKVIHFYGDYRKHTEPWVVKIGRYVDWTLLQSAGGPLFKAYQAAGCKVHYWSAGTNGDIFTPYECEQVFDGAFMGNFTFYTDYWWIPQRIEFVTALANQGFKIHLFGNCPATLAKIENIFSHRFVGEKDFALACSRTKICLAHSPDREKGYTSWPRVVNTMASGAFLLTRYFPGIEEIFTNHYHLAWFKTIPEGVDLFEYYLVNETRRKTIAKQGRLEILTHHTWANRIQELWSGVNGAWTH